MMRSKVYSWEGRENGDGSSESEETEGDADVDSTDHESVVSRRDAMAGGGALLAALLGIDSASQPAAAQTSTEPRIALGDDYVIDDDPDGNGDLVLEHTPSGAEFRYDSSADEWALTTLNATTVKANVEAGSVNTDDAFNSELGDSIDYLDPRWLGLTDANIAIYQFFSVDGYNISTSGSGSVGTSLGSLDLSTGSTSGSSASVLASYGTTSGGRAASFNKDQVFRVLCRALDSETNRTDYVTIGRVSGGNQGYGLKLNGNAVELVAHNGSSETSTQVTTWTASQAFDCLFEFTAGTELKATINGSTATLSSGLPSGDSPEARNFDAETSNSTAADRTLRVRSGATQVQQP